MFFFPDFNDPSRACDFDLTHHIASLSPADHTSRAKMSYVASCRLSVSQSWRWPRARSTHPGTKWTFIIDRIECWCVWKYWSIVLYILDTEPPNKTSKLAEAYIYYDYKYISRYIYISIYILAYGQETHAGCHSPTMEQKGRSAKC